jgi:hypothetical protein
MIDQLINRRRQFIICMDMKDLDDYEIKVFICKNK